jgi:cytochrome P450
MPLSKPIHTIDGRLVDHIVISKGSFIYVPIMSINRSEALWGKDAKNFSPGRWLNDSNSQLKATEIQGYRHLLTFIEGPRTCLGKSFALTEFKVMSLHPKPSHDNNLVSDGTGGIVCSHTELHI